MTKSKDEMTKDVTEKIEKLTERMESMKKLLTSQLEKKIKQISTVTIGAENFGKPDAEKPETHDLCEYVAGM